MKLFCNGKFIYFDKKTNNFKLYFGNMLVKKGKVIKFTNKTFKNVNMVNLNNSIILPAFFNAHLHLGEAFMKLPNKMSLLEYLNFSENFNKNLKENKQQHWDLSAHKTINDCLSFGTCVINCIRGHHIVKDYKIKALCGFPVMKSDKLKCFFESGIKGYKKYAKACKKNKIIPGVFFHSFYSNNLDSFKFAKKCNKITKTFFALHLFEDYESENKVKNNWGKDSIQLLEENNLLNKKTILVHGNYLSDYHLKIIKQRGASIVTCPISAKMLKNEHINVNKLIQYKINWCIATDGLATGITANLLENAKLLFNEGINVIEIFNALTINPAKALNATKNLFGIGNMANFNVFENVKESENIEFILENILKDSLTPNAVYFNGIKT